MKRAVVTRVTDLLRGSKGRGAHVAVIGADRASACNIMANVFYNLFCCGIYDNLLLGPVGSTRYLLLYHPLRVCMGNAGNILTVY